MAAAGDNEIAALREEMRRAGASTRNARWTAAAVIAAPLAAIGAVGLLFSAFYGGVVGVLSGLICVAAVVVMAAAFGAVLTSEVCRGLHERRLGRKLVALPPADRAYLLHPLVHGPEGDTRTIAESLMRKFAPATELAPAAAPDARGDEISPAERPT